MSSSVTFREATSADYDDVMNIGDIYDGLDYLPVRYHDYCADPRRHMFVAEDDGKVVREFGPLVDNYLVTQGGGAPAALALIFVGMFPFQPQVWFFNFFTFDMYASVFYVSPWILLLNNEYL